MMPFVDRFLAQKYPRGHFDFAALKVGDITSFVRKQATELGSVLDDFSYAKGWLPAVVLTKVHGTGVGT